MRAEFTVLSTLFASVAIIAWAAPAPTNGTLPVTANPGEWRYLNADPLSTRYSLLDQITKDNFKDLKIVWRWKPGIGPAPPSLGGTAQSNGDPTLDIYKSEATPIMANGVLYESAGGQRVVAAIDAATGKQLWLWNGMDENGRDRTKPWPWSKKAVHAIKSQGADKAYADISNPSGPFVDRELYIVVCGPDGTILAHGANKARIGTNQINNKDPDGKAFIKERVELAKQSPTFWQSYKFMNPVTKKVEPKQSIASGWTRRQSAAASITRSPAI